MISIISLILFFGFVFFEAWREAIYWHVKGGGIYDTWKSTPEEHTLFTVQRAIFFISIIVILLTNINWLLTIMFTIGLVLMFSFLHNGFYYMFRNKLNPDIYQERFFAQSTTSVAKLTKFMTPKIRTIKFSIGASVSILSIIIEFLN
jgi:hypothetical protein